HGAIRPREHGAGGVGGGARPSARDHDPPWRTGVAARLARRPDPRRVRAALVDLAESEHAGRRARLLARAQAPRVGARRARLLARVSPVSGGAVADAERVPTGGARLSA